MGKKRKNKWLEVGAIIAIVSLIISSIVYITSNISQINTSIKYLDNDLIILKTKTEALWKISNNSEKLVELSKNIEKLNIKLESIGKMNLNIDRISNKINGELIPALNEILVKSNERKVENLNLAINQEVVDSSLAVISSIDSLLNVEQHSNYNSESIIKKSKLTRYSFTIILISALALIIIGIGVFVKSYLKSNEYNDLIFSMQNELLSYKVQLAKFGETNHRIYTQSQKQDYSYQREDIKSSDLYSDIKYEIDAVKRSTKEYIKELENKYQKDSKNLITNQRRIELELENHYTKLNETKTNTLVVVEYLLLRNIDNFQENLIMHSSLEPKKRDEFIKSLQLQNSILNLLSSDKSRVYNALSYLHEFGDEKVLPILNMIYKKYEKEENLRILTQKAKESIKNKSK